MNLSNTSNAGSPSASSASTIFTPDGTECSHSCATDNDSDSASHACSEFRALNKALAKVTSLPLNPDRNGAPQFNGREVTQFLEDYEYECEMMTATKVLRMPPVYRKWTLPLFCDAKQSQRIRTMVQWNDNTEWEDFKEVLKKAYSEYDEQQNVRGSLEYFEMWLNEMHKKAFGISEYYLLFMDVVQPVLKRNPELELVLGSAFFRGLSMQNQLEVLKMPEVKHKVTLLTNKYDLEKIYEHVKQFEEYNRCLQALQKDRREEEQEGKKERETRKTDELERAQYIERERAECLNELFADYQRSQWELGYLRGMVVMLGLALLFMILLQANTQCFHGRKTWF